MGSLRGSAQFCSREVNREIASSSGCAPQVALQLTSLRDLLVPLLKASSDTKLVIFYALPTPAQEGWHLTTLNAEEGAPCQHQTGTKKPEKFLAVVKGFLLCKLWQKEWKYVLSAFSWLWDSKAGRWEHPAHMLICHSWKPNVTALIFNSKNRLMNMYV